MSSLSLKKKRSYGVSSGSELRRKYMFYLSIQIINNVEIVESNNRGNQLALVISDPRKIKL